MATGLPAGWEVRHSNSKNLPYYFNPQTKESRWEPPADTDSETLKHYMGQYHTSNLRADGVAQQDLGGKIRCAHLLVKHQESRRPSSWREAQITRTKDEAYDIIQNYYRRINSGTTSLGDLATTESDCPSARKRGDLGFFGKGDMQKEFEEASFVLKPGEVSPVIETASGLHVIERKMPEPRGYRDRDLSLPSHRVPFWAKKTKSLQIWLDNPRKKTDFNLVDYFENFSYLPAHLHAWQAPAGLLESLLGEDDGMRAIAETTGDWQKAAAALATALERTEESGRGARAAAYPRGTLLHSSTQNVSPAPKTTRSDPDPFTKLPPSTLSQAIGMESPPYTPFDHPTTLVCPTPLTNTNPDDNSSPHQHSAVDPSSLRDQLSPLSIGDEWYPPHPAIGSGSEGSRVEGFNELSWEYFVERHGAFVLDCWVALQRVRGFAGRIDVLLREEEEEERRMRGSGVAVGVFKVGVREYAEWWAVMRERAEGLGERVRGLETPRLGEVMAAAMAEGR
ncbi:peptidyl-prolyl cis-trans isomerase Pin1 [Friedmanniomyces endolithicus]|nr:peptidyl-prolyl cis-trans isomerase Pin1 [Friedmanniomyces endolithicus]KAK1003284.1 peptidyl-prolyl cis-trans isomerase Pin1 [Friedmanniomyces endolithicus]